MLDLRSILCRIDKRLDSMQDQLDRIERHLLSMAGLKLREPSIRSADMRIPEQIEHRLGQAYEKTHSDFWLQASFPLVEGINAFHYHFSQSTVAFRSNDAVGQPSDLRAPEPTQYLNLMKSIWIIKRIQAGREYEEAAADDMWRCYLNELENVCGVSKSPNTYTKSHQKCRSEYNRLAHEGVEPSGDQLSHPDFATFDLLGGEEFNINLLPVPDEDSTDEGENLDSVDEILRVYVLLVLCLQSRVSKPLSSLLRRVPNRQQELVLLRRSGIENRLSVQKLSSNTTAPRNPEKIM